MTQQPHSLAQIHAPQASWQHCLQQPAHGSNRDVYQQGNG